MTSRRPFGLSTRILVLISICVCIARTAFATSIGCGKENIPLKDILSLQTASFQGGFDNWIASPKESVSLTQVEGEQDQKAILIQLNPGGKQAFASVSIGMPISVSGSSLELKASMRTEGISGFGGLWMREEANGDVVEFDNMQSRHINGTLSWNQYSIKLPLHKEAQQVYLGALVAGSGKLWISDLQLIVDGIPYCEVPVEVHPPNILSQDRQFDLGSKVAWDSLSQLQIRRLVIMGKVWGFLKYYHPAVTAGKKQWDYELFRVLPSLLDATDESSFKVALLKWVTDLGPIERRRQHKPAGLSEEYLAPDLTWIDDKDQLGSDLSDLLHDIAGSHTTEDSFYVSLAEGVGNPVFQHERLYQGIHFPDPGFQLLAVYRFWNIIEYWYPYRNMIGEDWTKVLSEFIPKVVLAKRREDFELQMMALIGRIHDTHANLWSSLRERPPVGDCRIPIDVRFLGTHAVVFGLSPTSAVAEADISLGDIIESIDGEPIDALVKQWSPFYGASNIAALDREIAQSLTRGPCGEVNVQVKTAKSTRSARVQRVPGDQAVEVAQKDDRPGDTFQKLSDDIAYLKLSTISASKVDDYFQRVQGTKGLIIDIRNYPAEFVPFAIGAHLVKQPVPFVRFTVPILLSPGAFEWGPKQSLMPKAPYYSGRVVVLVDEYTQSMAEYTALALRAAPNVVIVGSTTAGADGNVSQVHLPGNLQTSISGIGVFYPNKKLTQRIGIVPDRIVERTTKGIRAGEDEVIEAAIRLIVAASAGQNDLGSQRRIGY